MTWRSVQGIVLIAMSGLVVILASRLEASRRATDLMSSCAYAIMPGHYAPLIDAPTTRGDTVRLGQSNVDGQVYLVYNTRCPYCARSVEAWQELNARVSGMGRVQVVGVSLDSAHLTRKYQVEHGLNFPSVTLTDQRMKDIHRFGAVPQTLVLDSGGRVILSRIGVLEIGAGLDSIMKAIESLGRQGNDAEGS